jgi:hypothetical protein
VCRTLFAFWNAGLHRIDRTDLSEEDPIRLTFGGRILACRVLPTNTEASASITDLNRVALSFESLNGVFDGIRLRDLPDALMVGYESFYSDPTLVANPLDLDVVNRARGFCVEILHEGPEISPKAITGRIGDVSLGDKDKFGGFSARRSRTAVGPFLALLYPVGVLIYLLTFPTWVEDNLFFGRSLLWDVFLALSLVILAATLSYYFAHTVLYQVQAHPGGGDAWDNRRELWSQRVPFALRARADVREGRLEESYPEHLTVSVMTHSHDS